MTTVMTHAAAPFPVATETCNYEESLSDFDKLKELSEKLRLTTRRPSVVQWKQIIEYRKSRGQYVTSAQRQNSGQTVKPEICEHFNNKMLGIDQGKTLEKSTKDMTSSDLHRTLFENNQDTPTKVTSQGPLSTTPTPTRRFRRIGRCIPELNEDVTNNNAEKKVTSCEQDAPSESDDVTDKDTSARYRKVSQMLEQLRTDLMIMRIEDNKLARKLLDIRTDLTLVRAQQSCQEHAEMIDDVTYELEEEEEITGLIKACDLPDHRPGSLLSAFSPLRHIGLSRMNLNRRRFSIR